MEELEKEARIKAVLEALKKLEFQTDEAKYELVQVWNDYVETTIWNGDHIYDMSEFDDMFCDTPPIIVAGGSRGDNDDGFDSEAGYFIIDSAYGRYYSLSDPIKSPKSPFDYDKLVKYIVETGKDLDGSLELGTEPPADFTIE